MSAGRLFSFGPSVELWCRVTLVPPISAKAQQGRGVDAGLGGGGGAYSSPTILSPLQLPAAGFSCSCLPQHPGIFPRRPMSSDEMTKHLFTRHAIRLPSGFQKEQFRSLFKSRCIAQSSVPESHTAIHHTDPCHLISCQPGRYTVVLQGAAR